MKKKTDFTVKFWGVRGSHPVPGETTNRYGGNTPCVEVCTGDHTIIFDAGTGIIGLGRELARQASQTGQPVKAVLFFSHLHHDHTQGFPFFTPAYLTNAHIDIFVPDMYERDPEAVLREVMAAPVFPVAFQRTGATKHIHCLRQTEVVMLNGKEVARLSTIPASIPDEIVTIRAMLSSSHPQGVMVYRVEYLGKSIVYATDTEGYAGGDRRLVEFARNADLLIHDAQYTEDHYVGALAGAPITQGYGHSTAVMACNTAREAKVGQLVLFHHDPSYEDKVIRKNERHAREHFSSTVAACEGQVINMGERLHQLSKEDTLPLAQIQNRREESTSWVST